VKFTLGKVSLDILDQLAIGMKEKQKNLKIEKCLKWRENEILPHAKARGILKEKWKRKTNRLKEN